MNKGPRFVLDMSRSPMTFDEALLIATTLVSRYRDDGISSILVIKQLSDGDVVSGTVGVANVDDVEIMAGASDIDEVACTVASVLDDLPVMTDPERAIPYILVEPYAQVTFYPDNDNAGAFIAEVYAGTGAAVRREIALGIFDALSKRTRWDLRLTSDDQPGDGVVAERFASAVGPSAP